MPFGSRLLPYKKRPLTNCACPLDASPRPWAPHSEASPAASPGTPARVTCMPPWAISRCPAHLPTILSKCKRTDETKPGYCACTAIACELVSDSEQTCEQFRWDSPQQGLALPPSSWRSCRVKRRATARASARRTRLAGRRRRSPRARTARSILCLISGKSPGLREAGDG